MRYPERAGSATDPSTVVSLLRWRAKRQPDRLAYRFLDDGERAEATLTYAQLDQAARAVAARLVELGAADERAILLYPPGLAYITALFGCLYAGVVAVPAYPPNPTRLERSLDRLGAIVRDARPLVTLTTSAGLAAIEALAEAHAETHAEPALGALVPTDETPAELASSWRPPPIEAGSTALLQYTSGSTAAPRGVVLSHGNLMHNSRLIRDYFGYSPETRAVAWLPPYHDMGLIGGILQPLYSGFPITLMSPTAFLERPFRWLDAISRFGATTSGGPNFAYELCVRKTSEQERARLNLSGWRVALNGAEPIRAETLERFAAAFEPSGFRRDAFHPCYGLAEATLIVTGGVPWSAGGRSVSCGRPAKDQRLVIADPVTRRRCAAGQEGEIWVAGPSVARSYWSRPELSREVFDGRLAGTGEGPFLRTGDLGFVRDGELFVTGRLKDLIIIRGRNHHPQDIESTAERSHPALRPGCGAAFTVPDGDQECLVVAWELAAGAGEVDGDEVASAVRSAVARDHDLQVRTVVLLAPGGIPKTSSGKLQRRLCASLYASGALGGLIFGLAGQSGGEPAWARPRLLAAAPARRRAMLQEYLRDRIAAACGVAPGEVDPDRPLLALGADSLAVVAIAQAILQDLGVALRASELISAASVTEVARRLGEALDAAAGAGPAEAAVGAVASQPATTATTVVEAPLSHAQRTLWFLQELEPDSAAHNLAVALRLRGRLDVAALRRALDGLVARHPVLRTTFAARNGEPVARIAATGAALVREHDAAHAGSELTGHLNDTANQPFDLASGPPLRVDLYHTAPGETVMLVVAHHIVMDFSSMATLVDELETLYAAGGDPAAVPAPLAPAAASYAEVVAWQEATLTGDDGRAMRAYWAEELRGAVPELRLLRRAAPAPPGAPATAGTRRVRIDQALTRRIEQRARAEGVTVSMVLLAAYQLLLHRYTGQADLLVGTPMAGRGRPEFERVVGYCMNPVAIRSRLAAGASIRDQLAQVRRRVVGALDHQTFPLHLLDSDRRAGAPPFQALFVFNRPPVRGAGELAQLATGQPGLRCRFADLEAEPVAVDLRKTPVDLHLSMTEADETLLATFRYRTDLLDDAAAGRMLRHFENLLTAIVEDAGQPAAAAPMLDEPEWQRILTGWNATRSGHGGGVTIVELIQRQVAATPDAVAVAGEDGQLTYRELDRRAHRVARLLTDRGISAGARVGLCLDRSPDMIVALLAALRSGAAYVPADPAHPRDRVAEIFAGAGVAAVLSQRQLTDRLPGGIDTILLDDQAAVAAKPDDDLGLAVADSSPVYVMYTSGSTGTPKGVVVSHRSLTNYVRFAADNFTMSPGDRVLQFASLSFDASAQQIFAALISGATLVLRNDRMLSSPEAFLAQCARWSVTVLDLPTAYWHELVVGIAEGAARVPATLRLVIIGGERAVPDLVRAWHRQIGTRVRLINNYGPTEATIVAITRDLTGGLAGGDEVPIGRPVAGATAYVLDQLRQPVPAGVVGELYLGGVGLADGYLDRPGLTAQSFVPHPFEAGSRLYRTGDLASFTPDGELVFRGRADRQVKLRGYRVEPAEIESALRELPGVADALVVLREEPRPLVGYLVSVATAPPASALRAALRRKLPEYMIPSAFVTVPALPLTHNGKVDVGALPAPAATEPRGPTEPRTPVERFLVETFAEVLGLAAVGVDDDFFGRGGHSLLASRLLARIRERFQVDLPLRAVFEAPTSAGLAELLAQVPPPGASAPPLRPVPRDQPLPLSFAQEGIWFLQRLAPESTAYNVPRALRIKGDLDPEVLVEVLAALDRRHEILRTTFPDVDGEPVQVIHPPKGIPVSLVDLRDMPEAERGDRVQRIILEAGQAPFDLANGPLIRLTLVRLGPSDHVLIIVEHHLVHDGWAQGVFLRDFLELYEARVSGREPRLPELRVQFADYAHWQRQTLRGEALDRLTAFWTGELTGAPWKLALPTDRPHPPVLTFTGGQETLVIDGELGGALRRFSRERRATLFMTMFSAFATLLYRYSGQDDILVGVGVANRQRPETENLLGMMINTVLLRAELSGNPSFAGLLDRVRERSPRVYAHQDMPFAKLVEALRPKRSLGNMPLCQVLFTFLDTPMPRLEIPGLTFEVIGMHNNTAKFDLNVVVQPHAEQRPGAPAAEADGRITVLWEYNADVFEATTVRRMLDHFHSVLVAAVQTPDRPLDRFLEELGEPRPGPATVQTGPRSSAISPV